MTKILEFQTLTECQACINAINQLAMGWWQGQGYTVIDGELIGKNFATGQDAPNKTRTTTWDIPKLSPDGTYWIHSLTGHNPAWADWKTTLAAEPFNFTAIGVEKDFPEEWLEAA